MPAPIADAHLPKEGAASDPPFSNKGEWSARAVQVCDVLWERSIDAADVPAVCRKKLSNFFDAEFHSAARLSADLINRGKPARSLFNQSFRQDSHIGRRAAWPTDISNLKRRFK